LPQNIKDLAKTADNIDSAKCVIELMSL